MHTQQESDFVMNTLNAWVSLVCLLFQLSPQHSWITAKVGFNCQSINQLFHFLIVTYEDQLIGFKYASDKNEGFYNKMEKKQHIG